MPSPLVASFLFHVVFSSDRMLWCQLVGKRPCVHRTQTPQLTGPDSTDDIIRSGLTDFTLDGHSSLTPSLGAEEI